MPIPESTLYVRATIPGRDPIHIETPLEGDVVKVFMRLPKDREIDPRDHARGLQQVQERDAFARHLGGWFSRMLLKMVERGDTVNGYPQEGPEPKADPINFASLGQSLARVILGHPGMVRCLQDVDSSGELVELLTRYCEDADRWKPDWQPYRPIDPCAAADRSVQILKDLLRR